MLTISDAATILEALASAEDPIYRKCKSCREYIETTPTELAYSADAERNPARFKIWFWAMTRRGFDSLAVKGTLRDMILDRLGVPRKLMAVSKAEMQRACYATQNKRRRDCGEPI